MAEAVQIGNATLHLGDCLDVLSTLPDASIEALIAGHPLGMEIWRDDGAWELRWRE